jgi:hypothetical protein
MKTTTAVKPTHTPTPWTVEEGTQPHTLAIVNDYESKTISVAMHDNAEDKANAAYIVRAVNSHEALLEIAKEDRGRYPDGSGRAKELDAIIAQAEEQ